jgi:hypothetical protein
MLTFDPIDHIYRWNGTPVQSVTQAIGEWREINVYGIKYVVNVYTGDVISLDRLRTAQEFGRAVHKAAHLLLQGRLDIDYLAPELIPPIHAIQKWSEDNRVKPVLLETALYSPQHNFSGTPDFIGHLRGERSISVVDYGTGAYGMKGPQTAAYCQLYKENARYAGTFKRYVLHIPKSGGYKLIPQVNQYDWMFFLTKLNEKKFLTQKGVKVYEHDNVR